MWNDDDTIARAMRAVLGGAEAVAAGDGLDGVAAVLQGSLRGFHPDAFDVGGGRDAEFGGEAALQVAGAEPGVRGQAGDVVPGAGVGVDGRHGPADRVVRGTTAVRY
jgi:hypothetical protein